MAPTPRFMFRANAVALGGRLYSPQDIVIEVDGASSLSSAGGRSRATIKGQQYGGLVQFGSASTDAQGQFDDPKQAMDAIAGGVDENTLATTTTVGGELNGLTVGQQPVLTIGRIAAMFVTRSATKGEPSITLTKDTIVEDAAIDGYAFTVDINLAAFASYDTYATLKSGLAKAKLPFVETGNVIYASVVNAITWTGAPYPGATIDQNRIDVPDFGSIVFGEIWIRQASRRLTMVRVDLGSPGPAAPAALKRRAGMKRRVLKGPKGGGGGSKNGTGRLIGLDIDPNGGGFPPFFKRL